jgi:hypothetical protein
MVSNMKNNRFTPTCSDQTIYDLWLHGNNPRQLIEEVIKPELVQFRPHTLIARIEGYTFENIINSTPMQEKSVSFRCKDYGRNGCFEEIKFKIPIWDSPTRCIIRYTRKIDVPRYLFQGPPKEKREVKVSLPWLSSNEDTSSCLALFVQNYRTYLKLYEEKFMDKKE